MNIHEIVWRYIKVISTQLIILAFTGVFVYKFAGIALGLKAEGLTTTDLLAILLAFFSISLAVFFYFKSTEESNRFYANSYEFTKAMSEMLGRIEAGFGERLRHIDEGYSHISEKFDNVLSERDKTVKKVEKEQEDVDKILEEKQKLIESLLAKTDLQEAEKQEILRKLSDKDNELQMSQSQLEKYQSRLRRLEREMPQSVASIVPDLLRQVLSKFEKGIDHRHFIYAPLSYINERLQPIIMDLSVPERQILLEFHVLDKDLKLTMEGRSLLRQRAAESMLIP